MDIGQQGEVSIDLSTSTLTDTLLPPCVALVYHSMVGGGAVVTQQALYLLVPLARSLFVTRESGATNGKMG